MRQIDKNKKNFYLNLEFYFENDIINKIEKGFFIISEGKYEISTRPGTYWYELNNQKVSLNKKDWFSLKDFKDIVLKDAYV